MMSTPGTNPVMKRAASESLVTMEYRIIEMLGGMMMPRIGEAVITPTV